MVRRWYTRARTGGRGRTYPPAYERDTRADDRGAGDPRGRTSLGRPRGPAGHARDGRRRGGDVHQPRRCLADRLLASGARHVVVRTALRRGRADPRRRGRDRDRRTGPRRASGRPPGYAEGVGGGGGGAPGGGGGRPAGSAEGGGGSGAKKENDRKFLRNLRPPIGANARAIRTAR